MGNAYLEKQKAIKDGYFYTGLQCGRQQIIDGLSVVLNDPEIMNKDVFGKDRLLVVVRGIGEFIDTYQKAWECDDETDYYRVKLDERLAKIYGDGMHDSFLKRYEYAPEYDYMKGKWKR